MQNSVERVPRQVSENQLLVALDDKSKVAIIADRELLDFLILAVDRYELMKYGERQYRAQVSLDLKQLRKAAF